MDLEGTSFPQSVAIGVGAGSLDDSGFDIGALRESGPAAGDITPYLETCLASLTPMQRNEAIAFCRSIGKQLLRNYLNTQVQTKGWDMWADERLEKCALGMHDLGLTHGECQASGTCLGSTGAPPAIFRIRRAPALSCDWRGGWRTDKRSAAAPHRTPRSPWLTPFRCLRACPSVRWRARWSRYESSQKVSKKGRASGSIFSGPVHFDGATRVLDFNKDIRRCSLRVCFRQRHRERNKSRLQRGAFLRL